MQKASAELKIKTIYKTLAIQTFVFSFLIRAPVSKTQSEIQFQRELSIKTKGGRGSIHTKSPSPSHPDHVEAIGARDSRGKMQYTQAELIFFYDEWSEITNDPVILSLVKGVIIPFQTRPWQVVIPAQRLYTSR